jgi:hypothetical protein
VIQAGTELIQFSPSKELHEVDEAITNNMRQLQGA